MADDNAETGKDVTPETRSPTSEPAAASIDHLLQAERVAEAALSESRRQAAAIVDGARRAAQAVDQRAGARVKRLSADYDARTATMAAAIVGEAEADLAVAPDEGAEAATARAAARVLAARLSGGGS